MEQLLAMTRRQFLGRGAAGIGSAALASMLGGVTSASAGTSGAATSAPPHYPARAKRVIMLTQAGAPSQLDLLDYKPGLIARRGELLPDSVRMGQRVTTMTAGQAQIVAPSPFRFAQHGRSGAWMSELLPRTAAIADDLCIVRSVHTEQINHAPAMTFFQTGHQIPGRPCIGAWTVYGLGSENRDLPGFIVMVSKDVARTCDQPLYEHLWSAGFLPAEHQGVKLRAGREPVLYLPNPPGVSRSVRRGQLDDLGTLNSMHEEATGDPEIAARVSQYELAFRMQMSVPQLMDLSDEPEETFELYGEAARRPGSYGANCILARRLAERGVRFIQLYHVGWDQHRHLPEQLRIQCEHTDQASAGLVVDLKRRGLLDDTLVVWGGEFGRSPVGQGDIETPDYGRDHHPRCFSVWMAGGGVRSGTTFGETDEYGFNVTRDPVHIHDLHATLLRLLGIDHERFTFLSQGRRFRLTDVAGEVVGGLMS
ncbi:MAG: DUF1501 domain-containing protein [Phycisphaerales bacterium]|nr:DUF1501 domain-containing protein [Phycisphaerales bacterium]